MTIERRSFAGMVSSPFRNSSHKFLAMSPYADVFTNAGTESKIYYLGYPVISVSSLYFSQIQPNLKSDCQLSCRPACLLSSGLCYEHIIHGHLSLNCLFLCYKPKIYGQMYVLTHKCLYIWTFGPAAIKCT
jgi:hypothetical protein